MLLTSLLILGEPPEAALQGKAITVSPYVDKAAFNIAFEETLGHEGGYVNDPADPGGATKYGISLRWLRSVQPNASVDDIKQLTEDEAKGLYYEHWWEKYRYGELPARIGPKVFDISVNTGPSQAHKLLQRATWAVCGEANKIKDDGVLGPMTLATVVECDADMLLSAYRSEAAGFYRTLVAQKPNFKRFIKGWLKRAYT